MKPGRELDALVAKHIMGEDYRAFANCNSRVKARDDGTFLGRIPSYSTDIAAAWEVVERLKGQSVVIDFGEDTGAWEVSFIQQGERYTVSCASVMHAICLAALKALNVTLNQSDGNSAKMT